MRRRFNGEKPSTVIDALRAVALSSETDKISVDAFSKGLGRRSYGLLLMTLNLPNLIPLPLPFLSVVFGLPLAIVAIQLAFGAERPWIFPFMRNRGIGKKEMLYFCDQVDARYGWFHKLIHPRLPALTRGISIRLIGLMIFILSSVMVLPIPLGNLVLAIPVAILSLGLIERDGYFVILGVVLGICGLCFNLFIGSSIVYGAFLAIRKMLIY